MISFIKNMLLTLKINYYFFNSSNHGYYYLTELSKYTAIPHYQLYEFIDNLKSKVDHQLYIKQSCLNKIDRLIDHYDNLAQLYLLKKYRELCSSTLKFYSSLSQFLTITTTAEDWEKEVNTQIDTILLIDMRYTQQFKQSKKVIYTIIEFGFYVPVVIMIATHYARQGSNYYYMLIILVLTALALYPLYSGTKTVSRKLLYVPYVK